MNWSLTVLPSGSDVNSTVVMSSPVDGATVSSSMRSSIAVICSTTARASGRFTSSISCSRLVTSG